METIRYNLSSLPVNLELATLAYEELKHRNKGKRVSRFFEDKNLPPIPWLMKKRESLNLLEGPVSGSHQGHLYVVLISGYTEKNQYYGAYVGSSRYTLERRFTHHKQGRHSSKTVMGNRGVQLLQSLCWPWQTVPGSGQERVLWESALHHCLETRVLKVLGDAKRKKSVETWPSEFQQRLKAYLGTMESGQYK